MSRNLVWLVGSLILFIGVSSTVAADDSFDQLIRHFRTKAQVGPTVEIRVDRVGPSELGAGTRKGVLVVGDGPAARETSFVTSADGQFVVLGEIDDVRLDPAKALMAKIDLRGAVHRGPADAPVTIIEYSDFQCPFCAKGYRILEEEVLPKYEGKVRFYYRHLPLPFHRWAESAAVAMECVKLQDPDSAWRVYDELFKRQREVSLENVDEKVFAFAANGDLSRESYDACVASKETLAKVEAQAAEAASIGISGTPSFVINGRLLKGAQPLTRFQAIIDDELARQGGS